MTNAEIARARGWAREDHGLWSFREVGTVAYWSHGVYWAGWVGYGMWEYAVGEDAALAIALAHVPDIGGGR